jgi:hypothetical protein
VKMVCPVWKRGECHSLICAHSGEHIERMDRFGSACLCQPLNKECEPCVEAQPADRFPPSAGEGA